MVIFNQSKTCINFLLLNDLNLLPDLSTILSKSYKKPLEYQNPITNFRILNLKFELVFFHFLNVEIFGMRNFAKGTQIIFVLIFCIQIVVVSHYDIVLDHTHTCIDKPVCASHGYRIIKCKLH